MDSSTNIIRTVLLFLSEVSLAISMVKVLYQLTESETGGVKWVNREVHC